MRDRNLSVAVALLVALAAGCGGGSWFDFAPVTAELAVPLAAEAVWWSDLLVELGPFVEGFGTLIEEGATSGPLPCDGGGTIQAAVHDAAPVGVLSAGDAISLDFRACTVDLDGTSTLLEGLVRWDATEVATPAPGASRVTLAIVLQGFRLSAEGATLILDGTLRRTVETPDGIVTDALLSGGSLRVRAQQGTSTVERRLSEFLLHETRDASSGDYSLGLEGVMYDSQRGGSVVLVDEARFAGTEPGEPGTGVLYIGGSNGSNMRLIAVAPPFVRIEVDADADLAVDAVVDTTWSDLRNS